jgi:hypothetical protein
MPRRSNTYQRLVAAIHEQLGSGWTVTESRMLNDLRTGQEREVDVALEGTVAGYPILVGIEVRDRGRVADVGWVEAMAKKHDDLPTTKLVLWSPTGFSKSAAVKAAALKIEAITSKRLEDAPWATMARDFAGGSMKWVRPTFELFVDVYLESGEAVRWPATRNTVLRRTGDGAEVTLGTILGHVEQSREVRTAMLDHANEGVDDFHCVYELPHTCEAISDTGDTAILKRVIIGLRTATEVVPVRLDTVVHSQVATSLGELPVKDGLLRVVVRELESGESSVAVTYRPSH